MTTDSRYVMSVQEFPSAQHFFYSFKGDYQELRAALDNKYSRIYTMEGGSLSWTCTTKRFKPMPTQHNDIIITGDLDIYAHFLDLIAVKWHTSCFNAKRFGIAVSGMRSINSYIWRNYPFDQSYLYMINEDQVHLMCWIAAYFAHRFSVPVEEIKTRCEYGQQQPWWKRATYPFHWDFEGWGDRLRADISNLLNQQE